jgi:hypothetical protein
MTAWDLRDSLMGIVIDRSYVFSLTKAYFFILIFMISFSFKCLKKVGSRMSLAVTAQYNFYVPLAYICTYCTYILHLQDSCGFPNVSIYLRSAGVTDLEISYCLMPDCSGQFLCLKLVSSKKEAG